MRFVRPLTLDHSGSTFDLTLTTENTTIVRTSGVENITIEISSRNARPGNL